MAVRFIGNEWFGKLQRSKMTVDGYIKEIEKDLFTGDDQFIPSVINDLCVGYYNQMMRDKPHDTLRGPTIKVEGDIIRSLKTSIWDMESIFFDNIIEKENGNNRWRFEIIERDENDNLFIGIWDTKCDEEEALNDYASHVSHSDGTKAALTLNIRFGDLDGNFEMRYATLYDKTCPACNTNDIIDMILEYDTLISKWTLKYIINGFDIGTAYVLNEEAKYRAVISFY